MNKYIIIVIIIAIIYGPLGTYAFASFFISEYCNTPLEAGEIIMDHAVKLSNKRAVEVYRGEKLLSNGDIYQPGEQLIISLSGDDTGQMVWESNMDHLFDQQGNSGNNKSGCHNRRSTLTSTTITIPTDSAKRIEVWAGNVIRRFVYVK